MDPTHIMRAVLAAKRESASIKMEEKQQLQQEQKEQQQQQQRAAPRASVDVARGIHFMNKFFHQRGSVTVICDGFVYLEMRKVNGRGEPADLVRQTLGPFHGEANLQLAVQQSRERLANLNAEAPEQFTNRFMFTYDPTYAQMVLDADFTQVTPYKSVGLDVSDLEVVLRVQWGAKRLSDGCLYAFTDNALMPSRWLHDLLTPAGRRFVRFADGNTLNCSRSNLVTTPEPAMASEIVRINSDPPSVDGKYKMLNFESGTRKYPHGRWRLQWTLGDQKKSLSASLRADSAEERERAKQVCLDKRAELIALAASQTQSERSWMETHPDARDGLVTALPVVQSNLMVTRNEEWQQHSHDNGFHFGPILRGNLSKHGSDLWCLKQRIGGLVKHEHFDNKETAMQKLLQLNSAPPYSINAWQPVDEKTRKILLEGSDEYMLVDEDAEIIHALGQHAWVAEPIAERGFEVRNANAASIWKRAIDLIFFLTVSKVRERGSARPIVSTPEEYFRHFDAGAGNDPRDHRKCSLVASYSE